MKTPFKQKAIFIDKDGTLINDIPYNVDPARICLSENALIGLKKMKAMHYKLIVISNQSGVALGYFTENALEGVRLKLLDILASHGIELDGFYYCPYHPEGTISTYAFDSQDRKPLPGMLLKAAKEHGIALSESWMIGDILDDIEAGRRAGCKTILLDNGNETEWKWNAYNRPDFIVHTINEAANKLSADTLYPGG